MELDLRLSRRSYRGGRGSCTLLEAKRSRFPSHLHRPDIFQAKIPIGGRGVDPNRPRDESKRDLNHLLVDGDVDLLLGRTLGFRPSKSGIAEAAILPSPPVTRSVKRRTTCATRETVRCRCCEEGNGTGCYCGY